MVSRAICTLLVATLAAALTSAATAQFSPAPSGSSPTVQDRWPEPAKPPQAEPLQAPGQQAAPKSKPDGKPPRSKAWITEDDDTPAAQGQAKPQPPRPPANVVACSGVFAKDSGHLKLAVRFDSRNVVYGQVDGPDGTRINASIVYPNDPKRRLEVLWNNEAGRSDTSIIAINGKSQWIAPKGLKLGLAIAALEKANGRPFKLSGFGKDGFATVLGWEGGALAALPGGCKVGMRLVENGKSPEDARNAVAGDKELLSNDASVRAVNPTIGEILIGY
jgi:hypothetical protein